MKLVQDSHAESTSFLFHFGLLSEIGRVGDSASLKKGLTGALGSAKQVSQRERIKAKPA